MKTILSIDGGGIRGVIPALILGEIEERTEKSASNMFDLIAGTSTGGIIALCLCVEAQRAEGVGHSAESIGFPRFTAKDLVKLYEERGKEIFERSFWKGMSSVAGLADEKYSADALERILEAYLGFTMLGSALTKVMVTAYDIEERRSFFIKSWREKFRQVAMKDAARATSAAPTYFEPASVTAEDEEEPHALIDGGVHANNPAMCAYAEARNLWPYEEIIVVSLGTGETTRPIALEDARNWGLVEWAVPLLNVIFDGQSDDVDYQLRQIPGVKYFRFQGRLDLASDDMDNASAANIAALGQEAGKILAMQEGMLAEVCGLL